MVTLSEAMPWSFCKANCSDDWCGEGSAGNAVQHAYWAVLMYFEFGEGHARDLLYAHEAERESGEAYPSRPLQRQMDYANDEYGLAIAAAVDVADLSRSEKTQLAAKLVLEAAHAELLCIVGGDKDTYQTRATFVNPDRCGG